jgi:hypothetical protein
MSNISDQLEYPNLSRIFDIVDDWTDEVLVKRLAYIEKIQKANIKERFEILEKAEKDPELQQIIMQICKSDPVYFFNMRLWTYNPRLDPYHFAFVTYPYQNDFIRNQIKRVEQWEDARYEKSRDMWFSWLMLWLCVRWFLFSWRSTLIGSYKQDYVDTQWDMDSHFERIRYILERLPEWMLPKDMLSKYMNVSSTATNIDLSWDSGKNFGTGWRRKLVRADEFSYWEHAETALRKTKDVAFARVFWWTPNGKYNVYGKVMTNHKNYKHLQINKVRLHRSAHPLKTRAWYEKEKTQRTAEDLAVELDISYDDSVKWPVYEWFSKIVDIGDIPYDPDKRLYGSRDFWLDSNAFIYRQKDYKSNRLYAVKSVRRVWRDIRMFAWLVLGKPTQWFVYDNKDLEFMQEVKWYGQFSGHFGDPYNADNTSTVKPDESIRSALQEFGIYLETNRRSTLKERITKTKLALHRISIDEQNNDDLIISMIQSHYPQRPENSQATKEVIHPVHDENSHFRTSFEYFIDNEPTITEDEITIISPDYSQYL